MKIARPLFLFGSLLTFFFIINANAQDIAFGGKLGVNFAKQTGNTGFYDDLSFNHRYHLEGFVNFEVAKRISLQLEAGYSQKGFMYENSASTTEQIIEGRFDYINVPLSLRYSYGKKIRFCAFGGAYAGMLLNAEFEEQLSNASPVISDVNDQYKGFDYGVLAGAGIAFRTGRNLYAFFEGKYEFSLNGIDDTDSIENAKNQTIATSIGIIYYY